MSKDAKEEHGASAEAIEHHYGTGNDYFFAHRFNLITLLIKNIEQAVYLTGTLYHIFLHIAQ